MSTMASLIFALLGIMLVFDYVCMYVPSRPNLELLEQFQSKLAHILLIAGKKHCEGKIPIVSLLAG